jgi:hypothetical protein
MVCSCPINVKDLVGNIAAPPGISEQVTALTHQREWNGRVKTLCRNHLRLFVSNVLGMVNNLKTHTLQERLEWVYRRKLRMRRHGEGAWQVLGEERGGIT